MPVSFALSKFLNPFNFITMKNSLIFLMICLFASTNLFAQNQDEGLITYEVKINMHRRIPAERAELKSMLPEFQTFKTQLFFKPNISFYTTLEEDTEEEIEGGGMRRFRFPQSEVYLDFADDKKIEQRDLIGKKFLIQDTLKAPSWKISDETKTIKGLVCRKATLENKDNPEAIQSISAWYAESMFMSIGPDKFHSLPGAILEVDINEGELTVSAIEINYRTLKKNELKIPSGGKTVTEAEFKEVIEEFRKQNPNGMRIIRN